MTMSDKEPGVLARGWWHGAIHKGISLGSLYTDAPKCCEAGGQAAVVLTAERYEELMDAEKREGRGIDHGMHEGDEVAP